MVKLQLSALMGFLVYNVVMAGPAAQPMITPPPLVRRDNPTLVGWVNEGVIGSTTSWASNTCKAGYTFTSAQNWFKCCPTGAACNIYTSCSAGRYLVGPGTTADCNSIGSPFCSSDLLYPSLGAISAQSYFWCGTSGDTGTNIYRVSPGATTQGSSSSSSPSSSISPGPTPDPSPSKSTPIGAIVGGVVGGLAVIGIAIAGVIFLLMRRKRNDNNNTTTTAAAPAAPAAPTAPVNGQGAAASYYNSTEKSAMGSPQVTQMPYMTAQSPPPQYASGVPQQAYSPQDQQYYQQGYQMPANHHQSFYGGNEVHAKVAPGPAANTVELDSSVPAIPPQHQHTGQPGPAAIELETPPVNPTHHA